MIENESDRNAMYQRAAARIERGAPEATPTPQPRENSGQFEPRERPTGREAEERAAGYKPLPRERNDDEIDSENREQMRAAAERIAEQRRSMKTETVETGLKDNVSITTDQATGFLKESRDADTNQANLDSTKAQQEAIDKLRATVETEPRQAQLEQPQLSEVDVDRAVNHPRVQKIITDKVAEAETQRQHFEASVMEVGKMRIAALASFAPELANVPLNQWANAIAAMHQREPARAQQVVSMLNAVGEVETVMNQMKAQKEAGAKAEFANYTARETQRFRQMTKAIPPQRLAAIKAEIPNMLAACGVNDPRSFLTAIQGQTVFPRASAELIMMKAAMYDMAMKGPKPTPSARPVPHVTRPGVAGPRVNPQSSNLRELEQKLNATGDLKIAQQLSAARLAAKKGRR